MILSTAKKKSSVLWLRVIFVSGFCFVFFGKAFFLFFCFCFSCYDDSLFN